MEVEVAESGAHEETGAGGGQSGSSRDSQAFLRSTAQHLAALLETTEAQLEILTAELLPPLREKTENQENSRAAPGNAETHTENSPPTHTPAQRASSLENVSNADVSSRSGASPATLASSVLRNSNADSPAKFPETNLQLAREYHQASCSLSRMLHQEIDSLDLMREGVCGNRVYNAVLQVENLQMLKEERKNLALLRKALSEL